MIAGAITGIGLVSAVSPAWLALPGGVVFVLSLAAQFFYIHWRHARG